jgi:pyruvate kinase
MMDRIIREVERFGPIRPQDQRSGEPLPITDPDTMVVDALGRAARELSDVAPINYIIVFTLSGSSARLVAKGRPRVPVIAITTDPFVARQLSLVWGVRALVSPLIDSVDDLFNAAATQVIDAGLANEGAQALFVGSLPIYRVSGRTNLLHIRKLER